MPQSFTPVQGHDYPQGDAPFNVAGVGGPVPFFHDDLDRRRTMWRATPEAQYPDGYLGTINPRRGDNLMNGLKARTTAKPYNRGVHKGEHRDPSDYIWPDEFNLYSGLVAEAYGERYVSPGLSMDAGGTLVNDGKNTGYVPSVRGLPGPINTNEDNIERVSALKRLAPPWASAGPGMAVVNYR